jgi:Mlc titration factor MtfA (ptsG expression regulator)
MKRILEWLRGPRVSGTDALRDDWASFLRDHSAHYRRLAGPLQRAFGHDVHRFITTQRITGVETMVDDPLRLLVAASAVTLSVGWPGYKWNEVSEVLLYPDDFNHDYEIGRRELAGIAHVWGTVILSVPSLRHSFTDDQGRRHLGFHEFAHLLTYEKGRPIRVPIGLSAERIQQWEQIEAHELNRLQNDDSVIDRYALHPSEFFPCAVEAFFQTPIEVSTRHLQLYRFLARYFRQSPAAWESKRFSRTAARPGSSIST